MKTLCKLLSDILSIYDFIGLECVNQRLKLWNFVDRPNYFNHSSTEWDW